MSQPILITDGPLSKLGTTVDVRSMTVGQFVDMQKLEDSDQASGFRMLSMMLHIDGAPIGWERLCELPMSDVRPALDLVNIAMGSSSEEDSGEG